MRVLQDNSSVFVAPFFVKNKSGYYLRNRILMWKILKKSVGKGGNIYCDSVLFTVFVEKLLV